MILAIFSLLKIKKYGVICSNLYWKDVAGTSGYQEKIIGVVFSVEVSTVPRLPTSNISVFIIISEAVWRLVASCNIVLPNPNASLDLRHVHFAVLFGKLSSDFVFFSKQFFFS